MDVVASLPSATPILPARIIPPSPHPPIERLVALSQLRSVVMLPHPWKSTEHHPMFIDCGNPGVAVYVNAVYFPNWRVHRQQGPASLNLNFISHVFYAFAW
jgi:hypothetical protein